jgi:hypothetical protein
MLAQCPFCSVVSRLYRRMYDKREPVLEAIANLANKLFHFHAYVFFRDLYREERQTLWILSGLQSFA